MSKKVIFSLTIASITLWLSCKSAKNPLLFKGINVVFVEKTFEKGNISIVDSSSFIRYFNSEYIIYKFPKIIYKDSITKVSGDSIDIAFINPDTTSKYFIIKTNEAIGLQYNNNLNHVIPLSLDSILRETGMHSSMLDIYSLDLGKPAKLEKTKNGIKIEKYLNKKVVKSDPDSIFRYYDRKLSGIDFSYSPALDKNKNSKLFKTRFIYLMRDEAKKTSNISSELYSGFEIIDISNFKKLSDVVKKYNQDKKIIN